MSETLGRLTAALADRYRIERELGQGGMATVYLAADLKHHRKVAVKVLRTEIGAVLGAERFLHEIETTANLRHPHILPLYDSGEADGFLYYVMPLVEGESLRDRLTRERQLPLDDALRIAHEVADALSYAHQRGVVHRDVKPENILLESGHAVVADFGIAKALDAAGNESLTQSGVSLGTPQYMSPEQAAGERDLDGRSDLYALACVLYEMLGGQPPFTGPTAESVIHQHLTVAAPPITNLRPTTPPSVAAALQRALAKTPADRFNPVAQFADALAPVSAQTNGAHTTYDMTSAKSRRGRTARARQVLAIVTVGVVATGAVFGVRAWRAWGASAAPSSVAVLPFADLSSDHSNAYLGDGIAETLINALTNVPELKVTGRTSAFSMRGSEQDVRTVGSRLDVAAVLEGSVQRAGDSLRVTAQLIKTADGVNLWSRSFSGNARDIFAMQDQVARAVVMALRGNVLGNADTTLVAHGTGNPAAYDDYLLGRYYWNKRTTNDMVRAAGYFKQAIAVDSTYARAWAGLADSYTLFVPAEYNVPGIRADSILDLAERAAHHAVALKPDLGEGYISLGEVLEHRFKWSEARRAFERGVALSPNYPTAHQWYAYDLIVWNRWDEGIREMERARDLDPLSLVVVASLGLTYDGAERWDDAARMYEQAAALAPDHPLVVAFRFYHDVLTNTVDRWPADYRRYAPTHGVDSTAAQAMMRRLADPVTREGALRTLEHTGDPTLQLVAARALGNEADVVALVTSFVRDPRRKYENMGGYASLVGTKLRADPRVRTAMVQWGLPPWQ